MPAGKLSQALFAELSLLPLPLPPPLQLALRFLEAWSTLAGFQRSTHAPAKYERCMEAVLAHGLR